MKIIINVKLFVLKRSFSKTKKVFFHKKLFKKQKRKQKQNDAFEAFHKIHIIHRFICNIENCYSNPSWSPAEYIVSYNIQINLSKFRFNLLDWYFSQWRKSLKLISYFVRHLINVAENCFEKVNVFYSDWSF